MAISFHQIPLLAVLLCIVFTAVQGCTTETAGIIQLTNGGSSSDGRVEICLGGEWGTVCDDGWSYSDAIVACRQLGFDAYDANPHDHYGLGSGPIYIDGLQCTGTEFSLLACDYGYHANHIGYVRSCSHSEDAGISCSYSSCAHGEVRLVDGLTSTEGRVEVCRNGRWTGICDSNWNYQDAFVVCRQLGYPATDATALSKAYFGPGVNPGLSELHCYGNESQLLECQYSESTCSVYDSVGVQCRGEVVTATQCIDGTLRLAGGSDEKEGRVEVCSNGLWGTICDGGYWDSMDATVVCSQLGFQNARVSVYRRYNSVFGPGKGPILFDDLTCDGSEHSIQACSSSSPNPEYCDHSGDVGVRCEHFDQSVHRQCTDGDIRLLGGKSENEGRVEVCVGNVWGSVCGHSWDIRDGAVVCQRLGYHGTDVSIYSNSYFGEGSGPYHFTRVGCDGSESNLLSCPRSTTHYCQRNEDAGVRCALSCTDGDVRLFGGYTDYEGRLDVCYNGYWVTVCDDVYDGLPQVVCRQLIGNSSNISAAALYNAFTYGAGVPILHNFACNESANQVSDCFFSVDSGFYTCSHGDDIAVRCYEETGCAMGEVRLADGRHEMEGRVEVCIDGVWGAVTAEYSWNFEDAIVVCRQLGFPSEWSIALHDSHFGRGNAPILASHLYCNGSEENLTDCVYYRRYVHSTSYASYDVGSVICQGNSSTQPECTHGEVRLVNRSRAEEGRVELCYDGLWRTICDEGWSQQEAVVVCKQLGLPTLGAQPFPGGYFGEGSVPILGYISCTGREDYFEECALTELQNTVNCHHRRDVGVKCQGMTTVYTVAVNSDQPGDQVSIGSTVSLYCNVHPQHPKGASFVWTSSVHDINIDAANGTFPNATVVIPLHHPRVGHYYCRVYDSGAQIGVGSIALDVRSLVYPVGEDELDILQENVTLSVAVNPTAKVFYNLRGLTWLHNGNKLISGGRVEINEDQTEVTLQELSEEDSGAYEARFTGLHVQPYVSRCEAVVLELLRHYPVLRAAVFHITSEGPEDTVGFLYPVSFTEKQDMHFTDSENITLVVQGRVPLHLMEIVTTSWTLNGHPLLSGYILEPLQGPFWSISQTLRINEANFLDAGMYIATLEIDPYTYLVEHLQCPNEYSEFVRSTLGLMSITLGQAEVRLEYTNAGPNDGSGNNAPAIAGGVIGGLLGVTLIVASVIVITAVGILVRKRSRTGAPPVVANPAYLPTRANKDIVGGRPNGKPSPQAQYMSPTGGVVGPQQPEEYEEMDYQQDRGIYEDPDRM